MRPLKPLPHALVLLCNRQRPPGAAKPSCGFHGADALRGWLKQRLKEEGLWGQAVRVSPVDCLDICPKAGVVIGLDGGRRLLLVDAEADREALLEELRALARPDAG
ncbi:MAG: (2Fe-2S) ferredoxin domain-containing protein [Alphaproteobacteria bacterium]|nr:(2Fe-2S) ferredoxin domain-containing protein [Alphaproteobacteria bacterium]